MYFCNTLTLEYRNFNLLVSYAYNVYSDCIQVKLVVNMSFFLFFGMLYLKSSTCTMYNHGINKKKMNVQYIYQNIDYVH